MYKPLINKLLVFFYIIAVSLLIVGWPASFFDHMRPQPVPETQPPPAAPAVSKPRAVEPLDEIEPEPTLDAGEPAEEPLIEGEGGVPEGADNGAEQAPADEEQDEPADEPAQDEEATAPVDPEDNF